MFIGIFFADTDVSGGNSERSERHRGVKPPLKNRTFRRGRQVSTGIDRI